MYHTGAAAAAMSMDLGCKVGRYFNSLELRYTPQKFAQECAHHQAYEEIEQFHTAKQAEPAAVDAYEHERNTIRQTHQSRIEGRRAAYKRPQ